MNSSIKSLAVGAIVVSTTNAWSQLAPLTEAATQPAKGRITWRQTLSYTEYQRAGRTIEQTETRTNLAYGINGKLSISLTLPVIDRNNNAPGAGDLSGFGDADLRLKWRFWQHDPGPVSTNRLALIGGVRLPAGADGLSSEGYDPYAGITFTRVEGRHGINASAYFLVTTDGVSAPIESGKGTSDLLTLETSYLFRLMPEEYSNETIGSLYAVVESIAEYETNGDLEWTLAPGILWEAKRYALELSVLVPIAREIDHRAETDWGMRAGLRVLF